MIFFLITYQIELPFSLVSIFFFFFNPVIDVECENTTKLNKKLKVSTFCNYSYYNNWRKILTYLTLSTTPTGTPTVTVAETELCSDTFFSAAHSITFDIVPNLMTKLLLKIKEFPIIYSVSRNKSRVCVCVRRSKNYKYC